MKLGARLSRSFFARPSTAVAPELLGRFLVRVLPDGRRLIARLVEAEAYEQDDPASHSFRGPTPRNEVMFGRPGHLYVYFTYGMHFMGNVVTGLEGEGSAVLLRAAEPLEGLDEMRERRGVDATRLLCSGPGRLAQAFGLTPADDGADLVRGPLYLTSGQPLSPRRVARTTRVGVSVGVDRRWRFVARDDPYRSPGRPVRG